MGKQGRSFLVTDANPAVGAVAAGLDPAFPPVYVVSVRSSQERRRHIRQELEKLGLHFEFFDAVEPRGRDDYTERYDADYRRRYYGYDLTPGEVGCFLSHRRLWELCAVSTDAAWCILEDDVQLLPDFREKILLAMEHLTDWDVLRLIAERWDRRGHTYRLLNEKARLMHYIKPPQGTAAYLIRPQAAEKLLAHTRKIRAPIDNMLDQYWQHHLRLLVLDPSVVAVVEALPAAIGARGWDIEHGRKRPLWRRIQRDLRNGIEDLQARWYSFWRFRRMWLFAAMCAAGPMLPMHDAWGSFRAKGQALQWSARVLTMDRR